MIDKARPTVVFGVMVAIAGALALAIYLVSGWRAASAEETGGASVPVTSAIDAELNGRGLPRTSAPELVPTAAPESDRSALRLAVSSGGAAGAEGAAAQAETDEAAVEPGMHQVTVDVDRGSFAGALEVLVASTNGGEFDQVMPLAGGVSVKAMVPTGPYVFASRGLDGQIGDGVLAEIAGPSSVKLLAPLSFSMDMGLFDSVSERPIQGGSVRLERMDIPEGVGWRPAPVTALSGTQGETSMAALMSGRWRMVVDAEGYAVESLELEIPGAYRDHVSKHGKLDYGPFYLQAEKHAVFELVNAEAWVDLTGFQVAYRHDGKRMPFSADGRATVVLGRHSDPLYMKLWYPDGAEMIFYVMGGAPSSERPHRIVLSDPRSLDVRLELSSEVEELIRGKEAWVRVAFQKKGYEKRSVAIPIEGSGVYRCDSIYSDDVTVSFITTEGVLPVDWESQWIEMESSGVTTTTLLVSNPPRSIRFVRPDGKPAPNVPFQVYTVPDLTGWTADGVTAPDGTASIVQVNEQEACLFAHAAEQTELLIEVPVDLSASAREATMIIGGGEPTFIEAICEGQPVPSVWLDLYGRKTGVYYTSYLTSAEGQTARVHLHPDSRADYALYPCDYWTPKARLPLSQGRNILPLWRKGSLTVTGALKLADVESAEFGVDLQAWHDTGHITVAANEDGERVCTVPVGTYRWLNPNEEWISAAVEANDETTAR